MANPAASPPDDTDRALRHELYLFSLYRVLEACLLALIVFSPAGALIGEPDNPLLVGALAVAYLVAAFVLLLFSQRRDTGFGPQVGLGIACDVVVAALATHALPQAASGIAMMLLFNVGAAALLLPLRYGLAGAALAAVALVVEYAYSVTTDHALVRPAAELMMFTVSYFAMATMTNLLGIEMRESRNLADQRGAEAANLAEINELIIRRMRTGVLMVDSSGRIRLANEAALMLLGQGDAGDDGRERVLAQLAPRLAMRLAQWRRDGQAEDTPLTLGEEQNEILPRFARLLANDDTTLVFLDDTSMVSRRAESLTLAAMGRFSASLAHEIRNPLAAISYATQLLEESEDLGDSDRRLLQIVHQQCMRTNGIVESVLGLARRERASPEQVELVSFVRRFIDEYRLTLQEDNGSLKATGSQSPMNALVDPRHLQQVLTVLVNNAIAHGRMPGESARITLNLDKHEGHPVIEVADRGPGIPDGVLAQLFRPFYTTSEHGTGLGLYIARELCRANEASLEYVPVPGGGACFRATLAGTNVLRADQA
ncbi:HAMP domain-containing sensor histidine kinase [Luteimonas vadosa]|uniref:histidine kinase n=1 Tax=Luteimonas vadosa TaxID=1165507 RepID=A0ABP9DUL3_9GAMM